MVRATPAARCSDALEDVAQQRARSASARLAADLLVVERAPAPRCATTRRRASAAVPHHTETRLSSRPDAMSSPSTPSTDGGARSCVMTSHATTSSAATSSSFAEEPRERPVLGSARVPTSAPRAAGGRAPRPLVHVTVEVDRELGQPEERAIDLDEPDFPRTQRDPTGEAEVAVEPRVDQRAAVHVDAELAVAGDCRCRGEASRAGSGCRCAHRSRRTPARARPARATRRSRRPGSRTRRRAHRRWAHRAIAGGTPLR